MAARQLDALRVLQDPAYAASLSVEEWMSLASNAEFHTLVADDPALLSPLVARYGELVPGYATQAAQPMAAQDAFAVIGKNVERTHGFGIVTGVGRYTQNMVVPGMLFMKTLRSPHPHAKVKRIDASKAEKLPGVHAVLHRFNLPKEYQDVRLGSGPPFRFLFPEEVFEVGAPVAVVAAESDHIADEAIRLIEVEYEVLPFVLDALEGMRPTTPKQWDNRLDGTILNIATPMVRGNVDQGFAQSDVVLDNVTTRSVEQHVALELTTNIMWWDTQAGQPHLNYIGTRRHAHGARAVLAQALKVNQSQVRVVSPGYMGASYGSHRDVDWLEVHTALLAKITGRPVRSMATRAEDLVTRTHRTAVRNESKIGVKRDGTIMAFSTRKIGNAGAYRGSGGTGNSTGLEVLYKIPNLRQENIDVFTNSFKYGSLRCTTHPNDTLAREPLVERAAYAIGMNPLDFRLKNLNEEGNPDTKRPFSNPGMRDTLVKAAETIGWAQKWHAPKAREVRPGVFHGLGLACHICVHGAGGNPSTGMVVVNADGTLTVISGAVEVGPGERTTMAMIAAETVGIPLSHTRITPEVDSDVTPDTGVTAGSRQTNSGGWGVHVAGLDAKRQLLEWGAKKFMDDARRASPPQTIQVSPDELDTGNGEVFFKADRNRKLPIRDVVAFANNPIIGRGAHIHPPNWERVAFATHAAEVEVDTVTGTISVLKYVAAHDVGRAINPLAVQQQIEGGVIMGLGQALTEAMLVDHATGLPVNDNILDYKILSIKDVPRKIDIVLVEKPKEYGVFGAHGIGEPPIAPVASVLINAVYNAVGVWVEDIPLTRDRVLAALKKA